MSTSTKNLWDLTSAVAVIVGIVGFLAGAVVALAGHRLSLRSVEFPLGHVQDIAVDHQGNIILALGFYGRIQLYDANGRFRRSWSADALGGEFTVSFRQPDLVASYAGRRGSTVFYTLAGEPVREERDEASGSPDDKPLSIAGPGGTRLSVHRPLFWPMVVRETDRGVATLIAEPWYLRPVEGPLPTWLLACAGGLLSRRTLGRIGGWWRRAV